MNNDFTPMQITKMAIIGLGLIVTGVWWIMAIERLDTIIYYLKIIVNG